LASASRCSAAEPEASTEDHAGLGALLEAGDAKVLAADVDAAGQAAFATAQGLPGRGCA
jgi:hypothetical protein